jgi:predicted ester cyclase
MTSSEEMKAAVRDCFENAAQRNFGALSEIVGEDYVLHPDGIRGVEGLIELVEGYHSALSGLSVTIDQQFTEGDYVATRFTVRGTHDGELLGTAPTGREIAFSGITVSRCSAGKLVEEWELIDAVGLMRQLGALTAPA